MASTSGDDGLTCDGFLGGRLHVWQHRDGYRAGTDPVLLAAAVAARPGETVLDLGCGSGVALLCLGARVPGLDLTGVELQASAADLARRSSAECAIPATIVEADIAALPLEVRTRSFDHVIANPPFFLPRTGARADAPLRDAGRREATPLPTWIETAVRRLAPGGTLTLIHKTDRLPEVLRALDGRMGGLVVLPLAARAERPADRMILSARKGARTPFRLRPTLILHAGDRHVTDGDDFTPEAAAILRDGAALPMRD